MIFRTKNMHRDALIRRLDIANFEISMYDSKPRILVKIKKSTSNSIDNVVFINQHLFSSLDATTQELNKIAML
ncbi:hypothetical protein HanLR1_Chr16g0619901 [Helianthus annuus]|nr:hypothetical protein HanLR1_Chr16g0619901 [Helianthus annuus]